MERRTLGRTGLSVGVIGLGTVKIGRVQGVKYPGGQRLAHPPTDAAVRALLSEARALGVNLLDTAPAYGESERRLGELLGTDWNASGGRDAWVLCTKVGEEFAETPDGAGSSTFDFSAAAARRSVERSLRRLRTDRLDIVLLHSPGDVGAATNPPGKALAGWGTGGGEQGEAGLFTSGAMDALRELRDRGVVRAVGASVKTPAGAERAVGECDVVMAALSPARTGCARAIALAHERGVGVLVKQALDAGHAAAHSGAVADAIRFAASTPGVGCVVVGTVRPEHLRDNVAAVQR